jgi:hypothetical protein
MRKIFITAAAARACITRAEEKEIRRLIETVAKADNPTKIPLADVKACSGHLRGCYRIKPSIARLKATDISVRVVFRITEDVIEIVAADNRRHVYRW